MDRELQELITRLQDADIYVRREASYEVRETVSFTARSDILEMLVAQLNDREYMVRYKAAEALGRIRSDRKDVLDALVARLEKDTEETVQGAVIKALGRIGSDRSDILDVLTIKIDDDRKVVHRRSVQALGNIGSGRADVLYALTTRFHLDGDDLAMFARTAEALAQIDPDPNDVLDTLAIRLDDDDENVRRRACETLREIGSDRSDVVEALRDRLDDESRGVREAAEEAIQAGR